MPENRVRVVFGPSASVEILVQEEDGEVRSIPLDVFGLPFPVAVLGDPEVTEMLRAWALSNAFPETMDWRALRGILASCGFDLGDAARRYPEPG